MKNSFTLSMGIVFLITILSAKGCKPAKENRPSDEFKKVTITLNKTVKIHAKNHIEMSDPKNSNVIDSLLKTGVQRGTTILWKIKRSSGIKKIDSIYPKTENHNIFKENPSKKFLSKTFKFVVPADATREEEYAIDYILEDNIKDSTDPYIRIEE